LGDDSFSVELLRTLLDQEESVDESMKQNVLATDVVQNVQSETLIRFQSHAKAFEQSTSDRWTQAAVAKVSPTSDLQPRREDEEPESMPDEVPFVIEFITMDSSDDSVMSDLTELETVVVIHQQELSRTPQKEANKTHSVSFGSVHVAEYERILLVNPGCTDGAPLGLGKKCVRQLCLSVDEFERRKEDRSISPKTPSEMLLSRQERERLLLEWGYTQQEMAIAIRETCRIKNQRRTTINNLGTAAEKMSKIAECARRRAKRLLLF
jgi:hypothetical protein